MSVAMCNELVDAALLDGLLIGSGTMLAIVVGIGVALWIERWTARQRIEQGRP